MQITLSYAAAGIIALFSANFESTDARMNLSTGKHGEVTHYQRSTSKRAPSAIRPRSTSDYISGGQESTARDSFQPQPAADSPVAGLTRTSMGTSPNRQSSYSYQWDQPFQMNSPQTSAFPSAISPGVTGLPLLGSGLGGVTQPLSSGLTSALPLGQGAPAGLGNNLSPLGVSRLTNALPIGGTDMSYASPLGGALPSSFRNIQSSGDLLGLTSLTSPTTHLSESPANLPSTSRVEMSSPQQIEGNGFVNDNKIDGVLHRIKHVIGNKHIVPHPERPDNAPSSNIQQTTGNQAFPQFDQASSPIQALTPPVRSASSPVATSQPEGYLSSQRPLAPVFTPVAARPITPSNFSSEQPQTPSQLTEATPVISQNQPVGSSGQDVGADVTPVAARPIVPVNYSFVQPQAMAQPNVAQPTQKEIASPISKKQPVPYVSPDQQLAPVTAPIAARPLAPSNYSSEKPQAMSQPIVQQPVQKQLASSTPQNQAAGYLSPEQVVTPVAARPIVPLNTSEQSQPPATSAPALPAQPVGAPPTNASVAPVSKAPFVAPVQNAPTVSSANKHTAKSYEKTPESPDLPFSSTTPRTNVPSPPADIGSQTEASPIASPARAVQSSTDGSTPAASHMDSYY